MHDSDGRTKREVKREMEVTYQMALEQMLPAYRKWDKADSRYDETVAKYPNNRDRIERATRCEKRAWDIGDD